MYFITSNKGKILSLQKYLQNFNCVIEVKQKTIELPEIQADSVLDVSRAKAKLAFEKLRHPLIVEDGGFCIEALNNFPGVYTRYILDTIGVEGVLKLMEGEENRKCNFISTATFVDDNGNIKSFTTKGHGGRISETKDETICPHAWSSLWNIYEVPKFGKTLSALTQDELYNYKNDSENDKSSLELFAQWYSKNFNIINNNGK